MYRSDPCDDRDDEPDRIKARSQRRKRKDCRRVSRRHTDPDPNGSYGKLSASLFERSDQMSSRSASDPGECENRQRGRRRRLWVASSLSELSARGADCRKYKLVSNKGSYRNLSKRLPRFWKKNGVQIGPQMSSGSELITALSVLAKFKNACSLNRIPDSTAVCYLQFFLKSPSGIISAHPVYEKFESGVFQAIRSVAHVRGCFEIPAPSLRNE